MAGQLPFLLPNHVQNLLGLFFHLTTHLFENSLKISDPYANFRISFFHLRKSGFHFGQCALPRFCPGEPLALEEPKRKKMFV